MILITGASGFVGHKLMELCKDTIASPSLRNATQEMVNRMIGESNADAIIHTAAISDIGACQAEPEASYFANVQIPIYLANACKENNKKLICFSSVIDGLARCANDYQLLKRKTKNIKKGF